MSFNYSSNQFTNIISNKINDRIESLEISQSNFEFRVLQAPLYTRCDLSFIDLGSYKTIFTEFNNLILREDVLYANPICQFLFKDSNMNSFTIYNSTFNNRFVSKTKILFIYCESLYAYRK